MPTAKKAPAKSRGPKPRMVYINVSILETTRKALKALAREHEMTQGNVLDQLLSGKLQA